MDLYRGHGPFFFHGAGDLCQPLNKAVIINHGLMGSNYSVNGDGKPIPVKPLPTSFDRFGMLVDWVEKDIAPPKSATVTGGERSLPMCSYPTYPKYKGGPVDVADSYECAMP